MKKALAILLIITMCASLSACSKVMCSIEGCENEATEDETYDGEPLCSKHLMNKKASDAAQEPYDSISTVYDNTELLYSDVYDAWFMAVYNEDDFISDGFNYLSDELHLSTEEVTNGAAYYVIVNVMGNDWDSEDAQELAATMASYPQLMGQFLINDIGISAPDACIYSVIGAYELKGMMEENEELLEEAKVAIQKIGDMYPDYEYYSAIKEYYSLTSAFYEYIKEPKGSSFDMMPGIVTDYQNDIRSVRSELDIEFDK